MPRWRSQGVAQTGPTSMFTFRRLRCYAPNKSLLCQINTRRGQQVRVQLLEPEQVIELVASEHS